MVGNDIIDLNETRISTNWERPGFMKKVFTPTEQAIIHASADPFMAVWQLWSMKESAYKVFMQAGGKRFYNPTRLECTLLDSLMGRVLIDDFVVKTTSILNDEYLFSTAMLDDKVSDSFIMDNLESSWEAKSQFIKHHIIADFAQRNSINISAIQIIKTSAGVPHLYHNKVRMAYSLSITHHGNYGAYSLVKN